MKIKILIPVFVFGIILFACSKKDDTTSTSGQNTTGNTFKTNDELLIDQLAIYTAGGVITDPAVIQKFISNNVDPNDQNKFYPGETDVTFNGISATVEFLYGQKVSFNGTTMEITGKQDSLILVSPYDSATVTNPVSSCDRLMQLVPGITPQTNCPSCTKYRPTYPILVSNDGSYYLPVITYAVSSTECASFATQTPMINILSNSLTASLGADDSVLVQVGRVPLLK